MAYRYSVAPSLFEERVVRSAEPIPQARYYKIIAAGRFPYAAFVLPITYITDKLVVISGKPYRLYITDKLLKGNPFKPKTGCGPNRTPPLYSDSLYYRQACCDFGKTLPPL